jgi:hypothetical protein
MSRRRKPESELRHWSTYTSVSAWFADYHGRVPWQMAAALGRRMDENPGLTFPEAYAAMRRSGAIIELEADEEPRCVICGAPVEPAEDGIAGSCAAGGTPDDGAPR